jgi:RHS repeat-associated protein
MTNKGNDAATLLSLPKGGGALNVLGEKFTPDPHTGTGNLSIPIALPPGRNGFQPQLSLNYSTGHGQGLFGLGWSLSIPNVARKTHKGIPRYRDAAPLSNESDTFVLSGSEDLVPVASGASVVQYRPRTEGPFSEIKHHRKVQGGFDYWQVRTKDGLTSHYGTAASDAPSYPSDVAVTTSDPASTFSPDGGDLFAWDLTLTTDPFGNRIEYLYERSRSDPAHEAAGHRWDRPLLKRIRYADLGRGAALEFLISIDFEYEARPDPFSDYRAGFERRTTVRCGAIRVRTHAGQSRDVKEYSLRYIEDEKTHSSLLAGVALFGFETSGQRSPSLPELKLDYSQFHPDQRDHRRFFAVRGQLPARSLADGNLELVDLHGQGLPDILEFGPSLRYFRNLGGGSFDAPRTLRNAPDGLSLAMPGVQLLDADGDGRMDLLVTQGPLAGYFPLRLGRDWDRRSFQRYERVPSFDLEDPEVRLIDLTGDGVTDAVRTGSRVDCYFNDPKRGWSSGETPRHFPNVQFSDTRVLTADMTGDGMTDIVWIHDSSVCYWPNFGHGNFGARVDMRGAPRLPFGYDPKRLLIGDINGDGLADVVYVDDRRVHLWLNQSGNAFSPPVVIEGTPAVQHTDAIRVADLLGTGIPGVLWSSDKIEGHDNYYFLDLTGDTKPYLLSESDNQLGAVTRIDYRPSTQFYLEDRQRGETPWHTTLPFPVQTVAHVEVADALSGGLLVTDYTYHHGYWDGHEREFRGFGRVEQCDAERLATTSGDSPPLLSKTWFHQGAVDDELGSPAEFDCTEEYWPDDAGLLGHADLTASALLALDFRLAGLTNEQRRGIRRDALRSLRGSKLRSELYALDGSMRQHRPYIVTEGAFAFREEAEPEAGAQTRLRIFFPHGAAQRTTQWERGNDPLTQISYTHLYDVFGQPQSATQIGCPRGWRVSEDRPTAAYLATRTTTHYANPVADTVYLFDRVARSDSFELTNTAGMTIAELGALSDADPSLRRIGQTLSRYDGEAFTGLALGQVGIFGALSRREKLVLTPERILDVYGSDAPAYLTQRAVAWPAEYPNPARSSFRNTLPDLAGFRYHDGGEAGWAGAAEGLFVAELLEHDFQRNSGLEVRGLVTERRNALDQPITTTYAYALLPDTITDGLGLVTRASYDLRFFRPELVVDSNGTEQRFEFRGDGLLANTSVRGKTALEGDWSRPSVRYTYDLFAFERRAQPTSRRTIRYTGHDGDADLTPDQLADSVETCEYTDGFGRVLQTRARAAEHGFGDGAVADGVLPVDQAAPSSAALSGRRASDPDHPYVIVSGWQIYDNKGRVVRKYEPFFSEGWDYATAVDAHQDRSLDTSYDPRGQRVRTRYPDGSEECVVHGVPGTIAAPDLGDPTRFESTPWEAYTYDPNDNAGRTHAAAAAAYSHCWNTPASIEIDVLGRTVRSVERNRDSVDLAGDATGIEAFQTSFTYDLQGNLLSITDALNRVTLSHVYDLAKHALRSIRLDAGESLLVLDALGAEIERRDSKGALTLHQYDALGRPKRTWARDDVHAPVTLRQVLTYGDELPSTEMARANNLLSRLHTHADEAGLVTFSAYDFKGNVLEKARTVIADSAIANQVDAGASMFVVDWDQPPDLEPSAHATTVRYDALDRVSETTLPVDADGERKRLTASYNHAGALQSIHLADRPYVHYIAYNARGQRLFVAYGNDQLTRYCYDESTFCIMRQRTENCAFTSIDELLRITPGGSVLQDFGYRYDLAGNLLEIRDRAPHAGIQNTANLDALDRSFTYDAASRLREATGRESIYNWGQRSRNPEQFAAWDRSLASTSSPFAPPGTTTSPASAPFQTRAYRERYAYDHAGNLTKLRHDSGGLAWTRHFGMDALSPSDWDQTWKSHATPGAPWANPSSNRLTHIGDDLPNAGASHDFDASGNVIREYTSRHFAWNHQNQLSGFAVRATPAGPASMLTCYVYGVDGARVKKWTRSSGGSVSTTLSVDKTFERHTRATATHDTLQVLDGDARIASVRAGAAFSDDGSAAFPVQYTFGDHLGSAHVIVGTGDQTGQVLMSREEFFPYGETSYGGYVKKRYRFTGKERDEESGLQYHTARYYAPWLARWLSCDPSGAADGPNAYLYAGANPIRYSDSSGLEKESSSLAAQQIERAKASLGVPPPPVGELPTFHEQTEEDRWRALEKPQSTSVRQESGDTLTLQVYDNADEKAARADLRRVNDSLEAARLLSQGALWLSWEALKAEVGGRLMSAVGGKVMGLLADDLALIASKNLAARTSSVVGAPAAAAEGFTMRALPLRTKGPTHGAIDFEGVSGNVLLKSGTQGPSKYLLEMEGMNPAAVEAVLAKRGYMPGNIVDVEVQAAVQMRLLGVKDATVQINHVKVCNRCMSNVAQILQEGQQLTVLDGAGNVLNVFKGTGTWH